MSRAGSISSAQATGSRTELRCRSPPREPAYAIGNALPGVLEGVVTWSGAPAGKLKTACGTIDNPTLRVGSDKSLRGVLVYIEKVSVGRSMPYYGRPANVGGVVVK